MTEPTCEQVPPGDRTLASLFALDLRDDDGVVSLYANLGVSNLEAAAELVAKGIAARRIGVNQRLHEVWLHQLAKQGLAPPSRRDMELLVAGLLQNVGTPDEPSPLNHLHGLVAEEIWAQIVAQTDSGPGVPIRVEGHDYSATDPGGDGLTIYSAGGGGFAFRLWESKYHGTSNAIRETVGEACRQVKDRALSYLTRFSLIAQMITEDASLASFYSRLPELWADDDSAAGVGVAVGTTETEPQADCFGGMLGYFGFGPERHQGHLNTVSDFARFAIRVRDMLWKGCGWIAH